MMMLRMLVPKGRFYTPLRHASSGMLKAATLEIEKKFAPNAVALERAREMARHTKHKLLVDIYYDDAESNLILNDFWLRRRLQHDLNSDKPSLNMATAVAAFQATSQAPSNDTFELKYPSSWLSEPDSCASDATIDSYAEESGTLSAISDRATSLLRSADQDAPSLIKPFGTIVSLREVLTLPFKQAIFGATPELTVVVDQVAFNTDQHRDHLPCKVDYTIAEAELLVRTPDEGGDALPGDKPVNDLSLECEAALQHFMAKELGVPSTSTVKGKLLVFLETRQPGRYAQLLQSGLIARKLGASVNVHD
eukprot:TRINITY_DN9828_c0_g1_i1.p1 TRINITY_DN9828_c0_g1~~TRINITY_DN9828_c0_g1_i1.p1  ORF type:complete len:308 (+),score=75.26 TRINITY_DN9828_c0_g1_i1:8-931(+)